MKILINTSNLYVGGGAQVAISFINELKKVEKEHEYYIFLSPVVNRQIEQSTFPMNFNFYLIEKSPSPRKTRKRIVAQLDSLETQIKPDVVFSVFGPSYWRPVSKHLLGFADPWVLNKTSSFYNSLSMLKQLKLHMIRLYKSYYVKRDADYFVIETEDGKKKLSDVANRDLEKIFVVGNTYSSVFDDNSFLNENNEFYVQLPEKEENEFRLMLISHNHLHKNIKIIKKIIPLLDNYSVKFVLTIDDSSFQELFQSGNEKIINIGPIAQKSCPSIYSQSDALFLPTFLEVFSASYPEAMKSGIPILTSDLSFAKDICQDAALYFDPLNPEDIAKKIKMLVDDKSLQVELVRLGSKRVQEFETAQSRAEKYIRICEQIVSI